MDFFYFDTAQANKEKLRTYMHALTPAIQRMQCTSSGCDCAGNYKEQLGFINLPFDHTYQKNIREHAELKKKLRPDCIVIIGIGGSSLCISAIYEALEGKYYNDTCFTENSPQRPLFYIADSLDTDKLHFLYTRTEALLRAQKTVIIVIISKSGTTTETAVNAALFIDLIRQQRPKDFHQYICCITDYQSPLWALSNEHNFLTVPIPRPVGGRYSIFSAVGMFPLALLGIDTEALCEGARDMTARCTQVSERNCAAMDAGIIFEWMHNGVTTLDTFFFDEAYESLGKWCRQLVAESLGKRIDCAGNRVERGLLPTVSIGTVDLHSMVQLYLGGPRTIGTTFIAIRSKAPEQRVPMNEFSKVGGLPLATVQHAIFSGAQRAYHQEHRPFTTMVMEKNAYDLGQFMQMKMIETVLLGHLLRVNPFDQPEVELYKNETRLLLNRYQ